MEATEGREAVRCIVHLCLVLLSCLFSVFTVRQNKHHRCLFSLGLQTERSCCYCCCCCHCVCSSDVQLLHSTNLHPIITAHTHIHTHTLVHTVYYHLSLCDGTEQQELYTLINQPTCQCIYNN